jgi:hypothetical protein
MQWLNCFMKVTVLTMTTTTSTATAAGHAAAAEPVSLAAPALVMSEQVPVMMDRAWAAE